MKGSDLPARKQVIARGRAVAAILREKARSNANRARLVKDLPVAQIGDEAFANDVQQATEKFLKAGLSWTGTSYPFTHDIGKLIDLGRNAGLIFPAIDMDIAESLTVFAAAERYETIRSGPPLNRVAFLAVMEALETWIDALMAGQNTS